jgi:hypothetical protein
MGDYKFLADEVDDTNGIIRTSDGAVIPNNGELGAWNDYQTWKAVPNTPDAAGSTTLAEYKRMRQFDLANEAEKELHKHLWVDGGGPLLAWSVLKTVQEAVEVNGVGSPAAARYPMLDNMKGASRRGMTITAVGLSVETDWDAIKVAFADVHDVYDKAYFEIEDAADKTAVDAVSWTWP